jgi:hypothetical protein
MWLIYGKTLPSCSFLFEQFFSCLVSMMVPTRVKVGFIVWKVAQLDMYDRINATFFIRETRPCTFCMFLVRSRVRRGPPLCLQKLIARLSVTSPAAARRSKYAAPLCSRVLQLIPHVYVFVLSIASLLSFTFFPFNLSKANRSSFFYVWSEIC